MNSIPLSDENQYLQPEDFQCPISFQTYTEENYPVTLPCGHTFSIQAFEKAKELQPTCPVCRTNLPADYSPQKNFLIVNLLDQIKANLPANCSNHPKESAVAVCTKDKVYLCTSCLRKDQCPDENIIPREKLKDYLIQELAKLNIKEDETIRELDYDTPVNGEIFSLLKPFLSDMIKCELSKQYFVKNFKEKQNLNKRVFNYVPEQAHANQQIKIFNDIEAQYKRLEDLKTKEQIQTRTVDARNVFKNKLLAFLEQEPTIIFVDNSLKELDEFVDKDLCQNVELCFKSGFNNRSKFYEKLQEFVYLESLSLQSLVAFENFGAQDLHELVDFLTKLKETYGTELANLNLDFAEVQTWKDKDLGLQQLFATQKFNPYFKTLQLSFKESTFIQEADFQHLGSLIRNALNIKNLILNFENCERATNSAIQSLFRWIKPKYLEELNLNFLKCPQLTQDTMNRIDHLLCEKGTLQSLTLRFGHSDAISCVWLQLLSSLLQTLRVSKLILHFESCPKINYPGVNHLLSAISRIQRLRELNLTFIDCKGLYGVRVVKNLSKCVKKLKNLKIFSFRLQKCPKFDLKGLEKFKREVKDIPIAQVNCSV